MGNLRSFANMEQKFKQILRRILAFITLLTMCVGMTMSLTPDGLALLEFKNGLILKSPLLRNRSSLDASPCSWGGIIYTVSGHVWSIVLSLQTLMLEGNISDSLGKLVSLKELLLDHN